MKHDFSITLILVFIFLLSQITGLVITNQYVAIEDINGSINVTSVQELPGGIERPEVEPSLSWIYIFIAIIIGTILIFVLIRFKQNKLWKIWFFISVVLCMTFALYPFIGAIAAFVTSLLLAAWKIFKSNFFVHNLTEIFIYGGLAAIFVPIMDLVSAFILLLIISIYDMIAVWQSKHMIKLAEFQTDSKVFAGLMIPYKTGTGEIIMSKKHAESMGVKSATDLKAHKEKIKAEKEEKSKGKKHDNIKETKLNHSVKLEKNLKKLDKINEPETATVNNAILGGGDIGFPLIFTGVIMKYVGFTRVLVIPFVVSFSLLALLIYSRKGKFYPAMPFLSIGCVLGYLLVTLLP
jgi:presenilin-like A22 family membrane protease